MSNQSKYKIVSSKDWSSVRDAEIAFNAMDENGYEYLTTVDSNKIVFQLKIKKIKNNPVNY